MSHQGAHPSTSNNPSRKDSIPAKTDRSANAFDSFLGGLASKPLPQLPQFKRPSGFGEAKNSSSKENILKRRADDELPKSPKKVKKVEENVLKRRASDEALQPSKKQKKAHDSAASTSATDKVFKYGDPNTDFDSRKKAVPKKRIQNRAPAGPTPPESRKSSSSPATTDASKEGKKGSATTSTDGASDHNDPAPEASKPSKKRKLRVIESDDEDEDAPTQLPSPPSPDDSKANEQTKKRKVSSPNEDFKPNDVYRKIIRQVFQGTPTIPEMHALHKFKRVETVRVPDLKNFLGLHAPSSLKGHGKATKEELRAMVVKYLAENPLKVVKPKPVPAPKIGLFADENKLRQLNNLPACRYKKSQPAVTPSQPPKPVTAPATPAFLPGVLLALQPPAPSPAQPPAEPASQAFQPSWASSTSALTAANPLPTASNDANHHHQTATHYCRNCCRDFDCRHPAHRVQVSRRCAPIFFPPLSDHQPLYDIDHHRTEVLRRRT